MDFDTSREKSRPGGERRSARAPRPDKPAIRTFDTRHAAPDGDALMIPAGSRKSALVHLALEAWKRNLLNAKDVPETRGRDVDEASLQRALYRSSMGEIEHVLGPALKGRRVVVEGRLSGTGRTALERLGAEVEELRLEDEKRYIDMTSAVFVFAAVAMALRYVSLGLDNQSLYILAGIGFALMYGLRPFFFKLQRPKD